MLLTTSGVPQWKFQYLAARSFDELRTDSEHVDGRRLIYNL
jgi:hypothetical protein